MNINYPDEVLQEIIRSLENDQQFQFKRSGDSLRSGICPNCGEKECFVSLKQPFRVTCGRLKNCKWTATTRELYPEIFENISRRHPATETNPNATADAYMEQIRGFDLSKIRGMYRQGAIKHKTKNEYYPAVEVAISRECSWKRIIDADDVRKNGAKTKIFGEFQGYGWVPPGMKFDKGDEIWITEGIFKSMALLHIGVKAISGLSASNFPRLIIQANKGKKITWVIAEDADQAGHDAARKFRNELKEMGELYRIAIPENGEDWDDVFRDGRLTPEYIRDSYWRGFYAMAETPQRRAFFHYCRFKTNHWVFDFGATLWRYKVNEKEAGAEDNQFVYPHSGEWNKEQGYIDDCFAKFNAFTEMREICPCRPQFLYMEEDILTKERMNCFHVEFANGTPAMLLTADGTIYKSPDNFSTGLLKPTGFAPFTGTVTDLACLHKRWFRKSVKFVKGIPFLGYEADSKIYVYPDFAYLNGQYQKVNEYKFFSFGRTSVKCNLIGLTVRKSPDEFTGAWINDFYEAFSLNGMVLLSWWLGTLFAEQIRKRQDSWPFLEYTGAPGAGKSTQLKFMWRCLGIDDYEGFDPNKTTPAGRARQMSQISNLPVVLLEGDRQEDSRRLNSKAFDFNEIKDMFNYHASIRTTGVKTTGGETSQLIFRGGLLISQNAEVKAAPAVLSRIVHCHVTQDHFNATNAAMADRLKQMSSQDLGGFLHVALRNERPLLDGYYRAYDKVLADFNTRNQHGEVKEYRIRHCHAQIAAWALQLPTLFKSQLQPEQIDAVINHIWDRAKCRQGRLGSDHPLLEQFWEIYEFLREMPADKGVMQNILNHSRDPGLIAINLPHFQEVAANHRQNLPALSELPSLFKSSQQRVCIGYKVVRSIIYDKPMGCWVFRQNTETAKHE